MHYLHREESLAATSPAALVVHPTDFATGAFAQRSPKVAALRPRTEAETSPEAVPEPPPISPRPPGPRDLLRRAAHPAS